MHSMHSFESRLSSRHYSSTVTLNIIIQSRFMTGSSQDKASGISIIRVECREQSWYSNSSAKVFQILDLKF